LLHIDAVTGHRCEPGQNLPSSPPRRAVPDQQQPAAGVRQRRGVLAQLGVLRGMAQLIRLDLRIEPRALAQPDHRTQLTGSHGTERSSSVADNHTNILAGHVEASVESDLGSSARAARLYTGLKREHLTQAYPVDPVHSVPPSPGKNTADHYRH